MDSDDSSSSESFSESSTSVPADSAGILMLSLPDSFDEDGAVNNNDDKSSADQDVFQTPPEYALVGTSQEKTPILDLDQIADDDCDYEGVGDFGDGSGVIVAVGEYALDGAVDLRRDADLVFPEAEAVGFRVSKRDSSPEASSAESSPPSKKLKVSEEELETEPLSQALEIAGNDVKSVEESSGSESENGTAGTQPVTEESGSPFGDELSFQEDGEIVSREAQVLRVVPLSFCSPADSSERRAEEGNEWSSLLEMVRLVREITGEKHNEVEKCSLLEIAKRRGMTFPRIG